MKQNNPKPKIQWKSNANPAQIQRKSSAKTMDFSKAFYRDSINYRTETDLSFDQQPTSNNRQKTLDNPAPECSASQAQFHKSRRNCNGDQVCGVVRNKRAKEPNKVTMTRLLRLKWIFCVSVHFIESRLIDTLTNNT